MLRSLNELRGYAIEAKDGEVGKVDDFLFDEEIWLLRYLVVNTGGFLNRKKVLVYPLALEKPRWEEEKLPVDLTKEQIEQSPEIDFDQPVSRQNERALFSYFGWTPYWAPQDVIVGAHLNPVEAQKEVELSHEKSEEEGEDPHLRSIHEVTNYHIVAKDGAIGHIEDFIADDDDWSVRYFVVDTRNWLPGKKVILAAEWILKTDWMSNTVSVDMTQEQIKNAPEYDPDKPVNREYEVRLYDYYGRPKYWTKSE